MPFATCCAGADVTATFMVATVAPVLGSCTCASSSPSLAVGSPSYKSAPALSGNIWSILPPNMRT